MSHGKLRSYTGSDFNSLFSSIGEENDFLGYYLTKDPLLLAAIRLLAGCSYIEIVSDEFGPNVYIPTDRLLDWLDTGYKNEPLLFAKYRTINNLEWLRDALQRINKTFDQLRIVDSEFTDTTVEPEWQPIPLDRSDEKLIVAADKLDCQSAHKTDPRSACKIDPPDVALTAALAPAELVGVAQPGRARGGEERSRAQARFLKRQLSLPVSTMSQ